MAKRARGEGSIYPYKGGSAAYAWVTTPAGERKRKYVYGKTRDEVHDAWVRLLAEAQTRPVSTSTPTVREYLVSWLDEVIRPNREVTTYAQYESIVRNLVMPKPIGRKKIDRLTVRDVQRWLNALASECQCCVQEKDTRRRECCAVGKCCKQYRAKGTVYAARAILRSALSYAVAEETLARNVAVPVTMPKAAARRKRGAWSVDEARRFLESAAYDGDPLYAAYVLLLVMALRRGELLGLPKDSVYYDSNEIDVSWQLRRVHRELRHDQSLKTDESTSRLPMPELCGQVLKEHLKRQASNREGGAAEDHGLVFTTSKGTPIDPRNFNRRFGARCRKAEVPVIRVHDARHTCASLLAALDVHPSVARAILRHSKIATTMEVYTEVTSEQSRAALRKLGESLRNPGTE